MVQLFFRCSARILILREDEAASRDDILVAWIHNIKMVGGH